MKKNLETRVDKELPTSLDEKKSHSTNSANLAKLQIYKVKIHEVHELKKTKISNCAFTGA